MHENGATVSAHRRAPCPPSRLSATLYTTTHLALHTKCLSRLAYAHTVRIACMTVATMVSLFPIRSSAKYFEYFYTIVRLLQWAKLLDNKSTEVSIWPGIWPAAKKRWSNIEDANNEFYAKVLA